MPYTLEVCVDSVASALAAKRGGADRLELCADLIIGGTTPSLALVRQVKAETGLPVRALLRKNVEPYDALGLAEDRFTDDQIIDFMLQHPILINRPIVTTPQGTRLCRPSEVVLEILTAPQQGAFVKEDGEPVIDAAGQRVK